jgi:hypothetical protein
MFEGYLLLIFRRSFDISSSPADFNWDGIAEELGNGEELYWALMHVIGQQTDFGPDDPVNNYRIKGQGDMLNLRIRSNP